MNKLSFFLIVTVISVSVNAQVKVNSQGKVAIHTTETPLSALSVGGAGDSSYTASIVSNNSLLFLKHQGTPTGQYGWLNQLGCEHGINSTKSAVGLRSIVYNSTPLSMGRAYGVFAEAGNATNGFNYGVYGGLRGTNNGAGVVGAVNNDALQIDGKYAGYFFGDVNVIGNIYGVVYSPTSRSASHGVSTMSLSQLSAFGDLTVTEKLSELSPMQYSYDSAAGRALTDIISDTTTVTTTEISDLTSGETERIHYGLDAAALQEVYPDLVYENEQGELFINYIEMIPLLVQSIQELQTQITVLQGGGEVYQVAARGIMADAVEETIVQPSVEQNVPNPFTESTTIKYALPDDVKTALLCIYDLNGKQLLQKKVNERGHASITIQGGELPAGMYLYSLIADGKVIDTKRMILTE